MRIRKKITSIFIIILISTSLIISLLSYIIIKKIVTRNILNHLDSISTIQLIRLESINKQNLEKLKLVSSRTQLRLSLNEYNRNPQKKFQYKMNKILKDASLSIPDFKEISVINLDGTIVASTKPEHIGTNHKNKDYFSRGQKENITNSFYLDKSNNLLINLYGPLILEDKLIGVILITASANNITELITDYSFLGKTGYSLLIFKTATKNKFIISPHRVDNGTKQYTFANYNDLGEISQNVSTGKRELIDSYLIVWMNQCVR